MFRFLLVPFLFLLAPFLTFANELRGTGDLGVVIERATGSILIIETTHKKIISKVEGLGDLSHASVVFSRDERFAYIFGRDGGLTKVDILESKIVNRIMQSGNSIGGAISQDGKIIAVSNYTPGGVKLFDSETLEQLAEIPAIYGEQNQTSKTVGLVDAPNQKFVTSVFEANEIWLIDAKEPKNPKVQKFKNVGKLPYDALISNEGRYYIAGLFGEDGLALLDLWHPEQGVKKIASMLKKEDEKLPVFKMPHLEGFGIAGDYAFVPAVGRHEIVVIDKKTWQEAKRIPVAGQPIFIRVRPDQRQMWVNFALPNNEKVQVLDIETLQIIKTLEVGKAVLHLEFTPRGEEIWLSVRDENKLVVYNTETFLETATLPAEKPSGIFLTVRAHYIGL